MNEASRLDILIDVQAKIVDLLKMNQSVKEAKQEVNALGQLLRQGIGIGSGMEIARRSIDMFKGAVRESVGEAFRLAAQLKDVSQNLGITTDALQVLGEVVKDNGGEFETLTQGIVSYRAQLAAARSGNSEAAKTFRDLGLSADQLSRLPLEQQLEKLAKGIMRAGNEGEAFDQAVKILGTRNAPKLTQSLRELADQGYGNLDRAMKESGRVMQAETIDRLDKAQKELEKFRRAVVIQAGEGVGFWSKYLQSARSNPLQTSMMSSLAPLYWIGAMKQDPLGVLFNQLPQAAGASSAGGRVTPPGSREDHLRARLAREQGVEGSISGDPSFTPGESQRQLAANLELQIGTIKQLMELKLSTKELMGVMPDGSDNWFVRHGEGKLTDEELGRFREYLSLLDQLNTKTNQRQTALGKHPRAYAGIQEAYSGRNGGIGPLAAGANPNSMTAGEGFFGGMMQWSTQMGSTGEQIAGTISGTIGGAVSNLTDGITGLIEGTKTWGDVGRSAGQMFLQSLVQLGVQMAVNWAVSKVMHIEESRQTKKATAEKAAEGGMKSIAQLGPIWGTVAFAASIAAIFALLGGFRERGGPVRAGVPYIVGERRPEVFVPDGPGNIVASVDQFQRTSPGLTASSPMAASKPQRDIVVVGDLGTALRLKRDPNFDSVVLDSMMRQRGELLNG